MIRPKRSLLAVIAAAILSVVPNSSIAFQIGGHIQRATRLTAPTTLFLSNNTPEDGDDQDVLKAAIDAMYGGVPLESPEQTRERIQKLVDENPVLLFMKGTKFFPQCGFSDTATKILEALEVDYEAVDVLSDQSIRQGIKEYSQWPTIPQLYINREFIGGSDIMINMFQSGELKTMVDELK